MAAGQPSSQPWAQNLYPPRTPPQPYRPSRPAGVVIIAILMLIGGALLLLSAVLSLLAAAWFADDVDGILGALFGVIGIIMLIMGLFYVLLALGLLKLKPWARSAARTLAVIGIVFGLISLLGGDLTSVVNLVINFIIFWYLGTPDVKAAFSPVQRAYSSAPRHY